MASRRAPHPSPRFRRRSGRIAAHVNKLLRNDSESHRRLSRIPQGAIQASRRARTRTSRRCSRNGSAARHKGRRIMTNRRFGWKAAGLRRLTLAVVFGCSLASPGLAASHREAPKIALDPTADITDVYFFRSWEDSGKVVLIMNVIPGQEPSSGPNYFNFDDDVLYVIHVDADRDGKEDIEYEFQIGRAHV